MTPEGALNHHLWRNRRTWWTAFTILCDGHRQARVRRSLGTRDVEVARLRRDQLMREYAALEGTILSVRIRHSDPSAGNRALSADVEVKPSRPPASR